MKRIIVFLQLAVLILLLAACTRDAEETPLYQKYVMRTDLAVAQVSGFQLNDTVKTDVVILVADDIAAWQRLKREFDIRTDEGVTSWMGNIDHPQQRVRRTERPAWRTMAVHEERTIAFYRVETEEQRQALIDYQLNEISK